MVNGAGQIEVLATRIAKVIFITGTSTGVGKTVATGILLYELRRRGVRALALKPFCTGSRGDVRHLRRLQDYELKLGEINPFFYDQPLAPYVAARGRSPSLQRVVQHIRGIGKHCDVLLVEGAGGLLVPLGADYSAADIINALRCRVIVVAANKLGTLNHTLLTIHAFPASSAAVLLMGQRRPDLSAQTNARVLRRMVRPVKVFELEYLGKNPLSASRLAANGRAIRKMADDLIASQERTPVAVRSVHIRRQQR